MSFRTFVRADDASSFIEGVIVGYWWRPVTVQDESRKPREVIIPEDPAHRTRLTVWWNQTKVIDMPLHEATVRDLAPLTQLWRSRGAS